VVLTKSSSSRFSKEDICNITRTAKGAKLKLSENVDRHLKLNQKSQSITMIPKGRTYSVSDTTRGSKLKLSENAEGYVELTTRHYVDTSTTNSISSLLLLLWVRVLR